MLSIEEGELLDNRFEVISRLGSGGQGTVFEGKLFLIFQTSNLLIQNITNSL